MYSYDAVFDEMFSSALAYTSRPAVSYTPYATSSNKQTGNIIMFTQFEEGNILSETSDDAESGEEYDDD